MSLAPDQLVRAYQIHDYLEASELTLQDNNVRNVIHSIVAGSFRLAVLRPAPSRLTRNSSAEPPSYPVDWAIDRGRLAADVRDFVATTAIYQKSDYYLDYLRFKDQPIPRHLQPRTSRKHKEKDYSTGNTSEQPSVSEQSSPPDAPRSSRTRSPVSSTDPDPFTVSSIEGLIAEKPNTATSSKSVIMPNDWENSDFTEQQLNTLKALIGQGNKTSGPPGPPGPPELSGPSGTASAASNSGFDHRFNPAEIDLFDPLYDGKSVATDGPLELAGKDTYIRDVHLFIDRVENMARIRDPELVRNNLYACFRGIAMQ